MNATDHRFQNWWDAHGFALGIGRASCHIIYASAILPFKEQQQNAVMWLGQWRHKLPPEAVSRLQDILGVPKPEQSNLDACYARAIELVWNGDSSITAKEAKEILISEFGSATVEETLTALRSDRLTPTETPATFDQAPSQP